MSIADVISLLSGIALFLFGMTLMGDGLKRLSDNRLGPTLYKLSSTPVKGVLLGSGVTAVIQSSSATSVLVMGFVNSGTMKLRQAIPVVMGAIFGTSITGWVICLSYIEGSGDLSSLLSTATLAGVFAVIGILLRMFSKKVSRQHIGDILMGFAILMFGMGMMSGSVAGLKEQVWFQDALVSMTNPFLGILIGILVSALLQSASAAVGIVQALSVTGSVLMSNALPLLMGISIGAALPVMLAAMGTNTDGKRTALSYLVSCLLGVLTCAAVFYILHAIIRFPFMNMTMDPWLVALVNTIFRLLMIVILLPLTGTIYNLVCRLVPEKTVPGKTQISLDERFTAYPAIAIEHSRKTIRDMARQAALSVSEACSLIDSYSDAGFKRVTELEDEGDRYEDALGSFLIKLSAQELSEYQSRTTSIFLHTLSDFERISDHARNIAESAKEMNEKKLSFSEEGRYELGVMMDAVREILRVTISAFDEGDPQQAAQVEPLEEVIDDLCSGMKLHHIERLQAGKCGMGQSFVMNDLLTNFERISDHCSNIAIALIEIESGSLATHEYQDHLKTKQSASFDRDYLAYRERFHLRGYEKAKQLTDGAKV